MLVWTSVATDTRVLREASALAAAGHPVHIIGRAVPPEFTPPAGVTVASVGLPPRSAGRTRTLSAPERAARWALLPVHVGRRIARWQQEAEALAVEWGAAHGQPGAVHAHDFSALPAGSRLARRWGVPLVYDSHELWSGRPVEGRPAPLRRRRERRDEGRLGRECAAVVTVGEGVAAALREDNPGWPEIAVVRNTFPLREGLPAPLPAPTSLVYAGRLAAYRELEVVARASARLPLPVTLVGPADETWLSSFDRGTATLLPSEPLGAVDRRLLEAGAALVTHSDRWRNHRLALPNKLFHAVSLGVPVVATDAGELGAIVRRYRLGTLYAPGDADALVEAVHGLAEHYGQHCAAVAAARRELSWEHDAQRLLQVYAGLT
jgi:glycosyltransferase involved in cell wall biosynthesis